MLLGWSRQSYLCLMMARLSSILYGSRRKYEQLLGDPSRGNANLVVDIFVLLEGRHRDFGVACGHGNINKQC